MSEDDILILDVRTRAEYLKGHIPGAINIAWEDWAESPPVTVKPILKRPGYWGKLANPEQNGFTERLQRLGVSEEISIVVYGDGKRTKGKEGRVAWMMLYLGHPDVSILNGGIEGWKSLNFPLQKQIRERKRSNFQISIQPERRILHSWLVDKLGTRDFPRMLDTRSPQEFAGKIFWYQPGKGRIPESHLIAYNDIFTKDGSFISKETYKSKLPEGYENCSNIGTYCEVGLRTCTVALLHEHYTGKILPVYDGSIMEWTFDKQLPLLA